MSFPFPVWAWQVGLLPMFESQLFYTSGLMATTWNSERRLSNNSNVGFVKQKA